jgi:hypothetical protein
VLEVDLVYIDKDIYCNTFCYQLGASRSGAARLVGLYLPTARLVTALSWLTTTGWPYQDYLAISGSGTFADGDD